MSDEEVYSSEEEEEVVKQEESKPQKPEEKKEENIFTHRPQATTSELDEQLKEYIAEWRKQRAKEEEELKNLREKQAKRKVLRAEEEKRLAAAKKVEDERRLREEQEKKQREQEEKRRRLEEAEKKRQLLEQASKATAGGKIKISKSNDPVSATPSKAEVSKTKEQLAEEKKLALSIRIQPLKTEGLGLETLKKKADELWNKVVQLETDKYDLEERQKRQDYDLKELKERQKMQLRHKAVRLGLEPEALTGKHPPKIQVASKFERTIDRRTYDDKKGLFSGGLVEMDKETKEKMWAEKLKDFDTRAKARLPKWFGERPGKKSDDPETPVEEEKEEELVPPPQEIEPEEPEEEEEEEESEEEEEEEEEEE